MQVLRSQAKKANGDPLAPATVRNRIRYLTSACRYGWKHHRMCEHDPAERVIIPTVRNERQEFASRAQMLAIARMPVPGVQGCNPHRVLQRHEDG